MGEAVAHASILPDNGYAGKVYWEPRGHLAPDGKIRHDENLAYVIIRCVAGVVAERQFGFALEGKLPSGYDYAEIDHALKSFCRENPSARERHLARIMRACFDSAEIILFTNRQAVIRFAELLHEKIRLRRGLVARIAREKKIEKRPGIDQLIAEASVS